MRSRSERKVLQVFGARVKKRRKELGLSQEKLAELADLHRTYIADIERGSRNVGLLNIMKIAHALGVPASNLLDSFSTA